MWCDRDGEYGKYSQTKTRQKLRNVERNPHIALSIVDPEDHLRYLGVYPYRNHRPGDERVVVFVRPQHTTQKNG